MWVLTTNGFYSAVQHNEKPDILLVRARCKEDLIALKKKYMRNLGEITYISNADYPYRAEVSKNQFAEGMRRIIKDITYGNFKSEVARVQGSKRASIYHSVWSVLQRIEDGLRKRWSDYSSGGQYPIWKKGNYSGGHRQAGSYKPFTEYADLPVEGRAYLDKPYGRQYFDGDELVEIDSPWDQSVDVMAMHTGSLTDLNSDLPPDPDEEFDEVFAMSKDEIEALDAIEDEADEYEAKHPEEIRARQVELELEASDAEMAEYIRNRGIPDYAPRKR